MLKNTEFINGCNTLKNEYEKIKNRVNAYNFTDEKLEELLLKEIEWFEHARLEIMTQLGKISSKFTSEEKVIHQTEVRKSGLIDLFKEAPYYNRIITKPEGYPGDAEMMNIIYRNSFEGKTPFAKFLHKQAVLSKACQAVRNRRKLMQNEILNLSKGRIFSLGAGPATEIHDVINKVPHNSYQFHALDQDIKALQMATDTIKDNRLEYSIVNALKIMKGNFTFATPHKKLINYCNPKKDFTGIRKLFMPLKYRVSKLTSQYDLGYSIGLSDYIRDDVDKNRGITGLTKNLFKLIKPGGSLILGNFSDENPKDIRFVMEYICDWNLIYRNKRQLLNFASAIPSEEIQGTPHIFEEKTGINIFLKIDKKQ